jgi:hypothetical protein
MLMKLTNLQAKRFPEISCFGDFQNEPEVKEVMIWCVEIHIYYPKINML